MTVLRADPDQVAHGLHHRWEQRRSQSEAFPLILTEHVSVKGFTRGDVLLFESEQPREDIQAAVAVTPPDMTCTRAQKCD